MAADRQSLVFKVFLANKVTKWCKKTFDSSVLSMLDFEGPDILGTRSPK